MACTLLFLGFLALAPNSLAASSQVDFHPLQQIAEKRPSTPAALAAHLQSLVRTLPLIDESASPSAWTSSLADTLQATAAPQEGLTLWEAFIKPESAEGIKSYLEHAGDEGLATARDIDHWSTIIARHPEARAYLRERLSNYKKILSQDSSIGMQEIEGHLEALFSGSLALRTARESLATLASSSAKYIPFHLRRYQPVDALPHGIQSIAIELQPLNSQGFAVFPVESLLTPKEHDDMLEAMRLWEGRGNLEEQLIYDILDSWTGGHLHGTPGFESIQKLESSLFFNLRSAFPREPLYNDTIILRRTRNALPAANKPHVDPSSLVAVLSEEAEGVIIYLEDKEKETLESLVIPPGYISIISGALRQATTGIPAIVHSAFNGIVDERYTLITTFKNHPDFLEVPDTVSEENEQRRKFVRDFYKRDQPIHYTHWPH